MRRWLVGKQTRKRRRAHLPLCRQRGNIERPTFMAPSGEDTHSRRTHAPRQLRPGPCVANHRIQRDDDQHLLVIDHTILSCTPTEYRVLTLLLEQADRCVPYAHFMQRLSPGSPPTDAAQRKQARIRLMHLMSHLRSKVWVFGLDIVAVMNVGYLLLSSSEQEPASSLANTDQVAR